MRYRSNNEKKISRLLIKRGQTLSVAESCSGGLLADHLTDIPGSSKYFKGGVVAYANEVKVKILRVPSALIKKYGAVSRPVAELMANHVRKIFKTDFGVSITGIAGPSGGTKEKPVGLTYIAISKKGKLLSREYRFRGTRRQIKTKAAASALKFLLKIL